MFLKGSIFITDDINVVYNTPLNSINKIINLDEDDLLANSDNNVIGGQCLLPPMEAKIAEADGNEALYDQILSKHLLEPFQQRFIAALIAFLYRGGNLLLFLPEVGYSNTQSKLINHLYNLYGLKIGILKSPNPQLSNCFYDEKCIPIWLNMIFTANVISAEEYLRMYPVDAPITNDQVLNLLLFELKPYGDTIQKKIDSVNRYRKLVHIKPDIIQPIQSF